MKYPGLLTVIPANWHGQWHDVERCLKISMLTVVKINLV